MSKSELKSDGLKKVTDNVKEWPLIENLFEPRPRVAVLRLSGVIADSQLKRKGISHARFEKLIEKAFETSHLEALALVINSPGGAPAQCSLMTSQIRKLADEKELPVYAFVEDVAASGGYWLACAGDEIYAQKSSVLGSIGVVSSGFGFEDFIEKHNIKRRIYTSGKDKSFLDPFVREKDADVKHLKSLQSEIHAHFKAWVTERRGDKLKGADNVLFEGRFWSGETALGKGLIDGFGDMRSVLKDKYGDKTKFVELSPEKGFFSFLPFVGEASAKASHVEAVIEQIESYTLWSRYGL